MTITRGTDRSGAIFSPCERYRYALWRDVYDPPLLPGFIPPGQEVPPWGFAAWIGLNPSTADENELDNTTRRCLNWTRAWGCTRYVMLNCFAFRSRYPKVMAAADDPIGPENDLMLKRFTANARIIVAAWGANCDLIRQEAVCKAVGRPMECLGLNNDGSPKHPLYVKAETVRGIFWEPGE